MSFFIIPHSSSFVNPFSEVFSNFLFCGAPSRETALILYHIQSSLSSTFSSFSKNFFVTAVPFPDQLFYYITSKLFCQPLFRSFFKFVFSWFLSYLCDSFSIISLSHQLVKYFLFKFLILPIDSWYLTTRLPPLRTLVLNQQSYRSPSFRCALVRQLLYYSTYSMKCQHLRLPMFVLVFWQQIVYISDTYRPIISETAKYSDLRHLPWSRLSCLPQTAYHFRSAVGRSPALWYTSV